MNAHRLDVSVMKFVKHKSVLYICRSNKNTNNVVSAYTMLSSVMENKTLFTQREVRAADNSQALYRKIGRPGEEEFQDLLRKNFIQNCPVTVDDAKRALMIYGPGIATLKGKTTRSSAAERIPTFQAQPIPVSILENHQNITICADFFFVQGFPFLHTVSRDIEFWTISHVHNRNKATMVRELKAVINLYQKCGFNLCDVHADNEFECIREAITSQHSRW
jgi:hypothetical protein